MSEEATLDEFVEQKVSENPETTEGRIETPIGVLPTGWDVAWLNDICDINPDGFSEDDWPIETFEYISISDVSEGSILQSVTTPLEEAPSRAQRQIREGDVLVGTVRPKQISHGLVTPEHDRKICSSGFGVLRTSKSINPQYLLQEVLFHRFFRQMEAYVAGSGYPAVKIGDLKKHRVAVPPLEEQRKIASVLYNVDQAIQKTQEIMEQLEYCQEGLMLTLFHDGYFDHEHHTETDFANTPQPGRQSPLNK
jgi:type I restriction enzyme S subunit